MENNINVNILSSLIKIQNENPYQIIAYSSILKQSEQNPIRLYGRVKLINPQDYSNIDTGTQEQEIYEYKYSFLNMYNEDLFKKYQQDFFVIKPEIGIIVKYVFIPFIEFYRYINRQTVYNIKDQSVISGENNFNLAISYNPFWSVNNVLEIDRLSKTELYVRQQRYIYTVKDPNSGPYTECCEINLNSDQNFPYDKQLHNLFREKLENSYMSDIQIIQSFDQQKQMIYRINQEYQTGNNQLIKFLMEEVFEITSLNLLDINTNIVLGTLWKQYMITKYQKTLSQTQIEKIIDNYMELLYLNKMDDLLIDYVTGKDYFNFHLFYNNLRQQNDQFEKQMDPYFYSIKYSIQNSNYNTILTGLYTGNEKIQKMYNLQLQQQQLLKGKISYDLFSSLLKNPNACGVLPGQSQLWYIPVGTKINSEQEMELQYDLYKDKVNIIDYLYKNEYKVYYRNVLISNLQTDVVQNESELTEYYTIQLQENLSLVNMRNNTKIYIGNDSRDIDILCLDGILYYLNVQIGYILDNEPFKLYIKRSVIDDVFYNIDFLQYVKYNIDYDTTITEYYNEFEFIDSTETDLIFKLRIQQNYNIRKGSLEITINTTDVQEDNIVLYDNGHGELVYVIPEPSTYQSFIEQQSEKLGKLINIYDNIQQNSNLEYIYQIIGTKIQNLENYLQEILQLTNISQTEIFNSLRQYLINETYNAIDIDSPAKDKEWITKIIDDNCLSNISNIQGYIDYKSNIITINKNLIKFIDGYSTDDVENVNDLEDLEDYIELEYTHIKNSKYTFYDPKYEIHYMLQCLLRSPETQINVQPIDKITKFIQSKYNINEINSMDYNNFQSIHTITYYKMLLQHDFSTEKMYDLSINYTKDQIYPIQFNKNRYDIFEMNDYRNYINKVNIQFSDFMNMINITKINAYEEINNNELVEVFNKNRLLLSSSESNIIVKLLDQINTEIKETQFYSGQRYILNDKSSLNVNRLYNFQNYDYTNGINSIFKDSNMIEYFLQFSLNQYYILPYFENKSTILDQINVNNNKVNSYMPTNNKIQLYKMDKLQFYIKQNNQTFYFEW